MKRGKFHLSFSTTRLARFRAIVTLRVSFIMSSWSRQLEFSIMCFPFSAFSRCLSSVSSLLFFSCPFFYSVPKILLSFPPSQKPAVSSLHEQWSLIIWRVLRPSRSAPNFPWELFRRAASLKTALNALQSWQKGDFQVVLLFLIDWRNKYDRCEALTIQITGMRHLVLKQRNHLNRSPQMISQVWWGGVFRSRTD